MSVYRFHTDSAHGWLEVSRAKAEALGILSQISACSYQSTDGETLYLEEDCDAGLFVTALKAAGGDWAFPKHVDDGDRSYIRNLPHFKKS